MSTYNPIAASDIPPTTRENNSITRNDDYPVRKCDDDSLMGDTHCRNDISTS